jgi:Domain of unknown function (DUF6968)
VSEGIPVGLDAIDVVIAEKTLTLLESDGSSRLVLVRLGKPERSPQADNYYCPFQFVGLGSEKVHRIFGLDAFQALQLAQRTISVLLHHYRKESNLVLYWLERGDDMGFPEPLEET